MPIFLQAQSVDTIIDSYMITILVRLEEKVNDVTGIFVEDAIILCAIMMLFYLSVQAYTLMTGDGKVNLLPLLRPFIFFFIVANWSAFVDLLSQPLSILDSKAKNRFTDIRVNINDRYAERLLKQKQVYSIIFEETQTYQEVEDSRDVWEKLGDLPGALREQIQQSLARGAEILQTRISTFFERAIEQLITIIFKGCIYLLYYIRILLLAILRLIGPFIFALSIIGAYRDLYLQWISKFVSVSLYGVFAHIAIMLSFLLIDFGLETDIAFLDNIIALNAAGDPNSGATILNVFASPNGGGLGLVICAVTGIFGLLMVPLISTWVLGSNSTSTVASKAVAGVGSVIKG